MEQNKKVVELFDGKEMPIIGLGTLDISEENIENTVSNALELGYRLIDTAFIHSNEAKIGKCIKEFLASEKNIQREDLFIISKLPFTGMHKGKVEHFFNLSLKDLDLEYLDMYMIQCPVGMKHKCDDEFLTSNPDGSLAIDCGTNLVDIWKEMEQLVDSGLTRYIGLCNCNEKQIEKIMEKCEVQPANLQIEVHAYFQQKDVRLFCRERKISVTAMCPLGSPGRDKMFWSNGSNATKVLLQDPLLVELADSCSKTPAQVLLRHSIQKNICVIPKAESIEHLKENLDIFDFFLIPNEMRSLDTLDQGKWARTFDFSFLGPAFLSHAEYPFVVEEDEAAGGH